MSDPRFTTFHTRARRDGDQWVIEIGHVTVRAPDTTELEKAGLATAVIYTGNPDITLVVDYL